MKHLQVGAIVAGFTVLALAVVVVIWTFFNWLIGPIGATAAVTVAVLVATIATVIDWKTEKREG